MKLSASESEPSLSSKVLPLPPTSSRASVLARDPALRLRNSANFSPDALAALIPPDKNAYPHLQIFQVLAEVARTNLVALFIPETLLMKSGALSQTLLCTRADGFIAVYRGIYGLDKFFEAVRLRTQKGEKLSQTEFVFRGEDETRVCDTQEEAVHLLCRPDLSGEMQACVHSRASELLRVHWNSGKVEVFLVRTSDAAKDKHSSSLSRITQRSKIEVSMYQHKPAEFVYAGKLLRSSFSPYCPFKSVLASPPQSPSPSTKLSIRELGRNATTDRALERDLLIGDRRTSFPQIMLDPDLRGAQAIKLESKYPELEKMGETLLSAIETWRKVPSGSLTEAVFDCAVCTDGRYCFLRCLGVSQSSPTSPAVEEESSSLNSSRSSDMCRRVIGSPQHNSIKKKVPIKRISRADNVEFYEKTLKMKKNGMMPFKIIGVHAKNHETQLLTSFQERLDPLLRAHRLRKKPPAPKPDSISEFMTKVENSYDELRVKARQSKYDMGDIRKIVQGIVKDTNFGERIFFSFFERTRMNPHLSEVFSHKTREEIKQIRSKFIEILQDVNLLTTPPRYRPTAASVGITSEQYVLFDGILQKVLEIEDLPPLIIPITKERVFIVIGEILEGF